MGNILEEGEKDKMEEPVFPKFDFDGITNQLASDIADNLPNLEDIEHERK